MTEPVERIYVLFTDDEEDAWGEVLARRQMSSLNPAAYRGWDVGEVALMDNPPVTDKKYCVFQIRANK